MGPPRRVIRCDRPPDYLHRVDQKVVLVRWDYRLQLFDLEEGKLERLWKGDE